MLFSGELAIASSRRKSHEIDGEVAEKLLGFVAWWEEYAEKWGFTLQQNLAVGNYQGGLTTIAEKSLGAIAKAGTTPLTGVYRFAERIDTPGQGFMDSPGYDPVSVTGMVASQIDFYLFIMCPRTHSASQDVCFA